jgi:poly [ADP-ribose] polymerase 6/8
MSDSSDELLIETDDDGTPDFTPDPEAPVNQTAVDTFTRGLETFKVVMPDVPMQFKGTGEVRLSLSPDFLPLALRAVYGFNILTPAGELSDLLDMGFELADFRWDTRPRRLTVRHPILDLAYVGFPLVQTVLSRFFSDGYQPQARYRSQIYLLVPPGRARDEDVELLFQNGFDRQRAIRALVLCDNDTVKAAAFLNTGLDPRSMVHLTVDYTECPLLYLVLEIADVFLDLQDHCCICRTPMLAGFKPSLCTKELCRFQLTRIGCGNSVYQEIARDPLVADLMVSILATALQGNFVGDDLPPILGSADEMIHFFGRIPSMVELLQEAHDDRGLAALLGERQLELIRWILLSNRSHLISLPKEMCVRELGDSAQFLTLLSSPEAEDIFQKLKAEFGSCYLWHGSSAERWHSIVRTGLRNATGTALQANGAARGSGIYLAASSNVSWQYSKFLKNNYRKSVLKSPLHIMALCEVATIPSSDVSKVITSINGAQVAVNGFLKQHSDFTGGRGDPIYTCSMEAAVVVRMIVVGSSFALNMARRPPTKLPTLRDVLEFRASHMVA